MTFKVNNKKHDVEFMFAKDEGSVLEAECCTISLLKRNPENKDIEVLEVKKL